MAVIQERKTQDGKIKYRVLIRLRGYPPQSATFSRKTDAKKWAQDTESAIRDGRYFKNAEAKRHTVSELVDKYTKQVLPLKPKMQQQQETQLKWWDRQIGHYVLADVTPAMISECRDCLLGEVTYRGQKRSPATVVRYMAALSHAFNIAINEWEWLNVNPVSKVKKPQESRGRVRFLSDGERIALLEQCEDSSNDALYPVVLIAISTGMRQGEILRLKWKDIDFDRRQLVIHESKNNERRVVPIVGLANKILNKRRVACEVNAEGAKSGYIFPKCADRGLFAIRKAWDKAVLNAKIEDFRFHDLRHTAASYLAMNGATLAEIAEVLGHKTLQMVKRYAHLSEAHTASVVERMNSKIFGNGGS